MVILWYAVLNYLIFICIKEFSIYQGLEGLYRL